MFPIWELCIFAYAGNCNKSTKDFWNVHKDAEQLLKSWYAEVKKADWKSPVDIVKHYRTASILKNRRAVFNIKGNDYRLVTAINYEFRIVYIRFVGTHKEYDKINAEKI